MTVCVFVAGYIRLYSTFNILFVHILTSFFLPDDYIAIGADCDELGAQIEEYILFTLDMFLQHLIVCWLVSPLIN